MTWENKLASWIWLALGCTLFGLLTAVSAIKSYEELKGIVKARSVASWPAANATIKKVKLRKHVGHKGKKSYKVLVDYEYDVNDKRFQGNRIHPAYSQSNAEGHHPLHAKLKNARVVKAYFNPENPAEAYIVSGSYSDHLSRLFVYLMCFSFSALLLFYLCVRNSGNSDYAQGLKVVRKAAAPTRKKR